MQEALVVSEAAAVKIADLIAEEGNDKLKLRVYVTGGGCSGLKYEFTFDENIQADDAVVSRALVSAVPARFSQVQVLVDALSLQYLHGAEIDYKNDVEGEQFIIRNPNAKTTCGCGSSFTAEG